MKIDRARVERFRRMVSIVGLSFALGALTDVVLAWRLRLNGLDRPAQSEPLMTARERSPDAIATTSAVVGEDPIQMLRRRDLLVPVDGVTRDQLHDAFADPRNGGRSHEAIDILAPLRTPVRAVDDGTVEKLFTSDAGGLTIYQFDPSKTFCYYYAHLDGYVDGLTDQQAVRRGQLIGYVGTTGNAAPQVPHLHFAVFRLGPERQWWKGTPLNPYLLFAH